MDKELVSLLGSFYESLGEAHRKRNEILDYLEDKYDIDRYEDAGRIEDSEVWMFGISEESLEELIEEKTNV